MWRTARTATGPARRVRPAQSDAPLQKKIMHAGGVALGRARGPEQASPPTRALAPCAAASYAALGRWCGWPLSVGLGSGWCVVALTGADGIAGWARDRSVGATLKTGRGWRGQQRPGNHAPGAAAQLAFGERWRAAALRWSEPALRTLKHPARPARAESPWQKIARALPASSRAPAAFIAAAPNQLFRARWPSGSRRGRLEQRPAPI